MEIPGTSPAGGMLDQATAGADEARVRRLGEKAASPENREALARSAREFEAVFMNTLLKAMRKTVPDDKLFNGGGSTKFYREMHDAELARAMSSGRSGMGIADLIIQQFAAGVDAAGAATAQPPAPGPGLRALAANRARPGIMPTLPDPQATEIFGPPAPAAAPPTHRTTAPTTAPAAAPAALARYRTVGPVAQEVAGMARLRNRAATQEPAVADTLSRFEREIGTAAAESGLPPSLILAVVMEESGGDPQVRSPKGATGLMQLMPATAEELGVKDATSPAQNLSGGSQYLARMLRRYEGRLDLALAAYNAGPGNVDRAGRRVPKFVETQRYVRKVMERHQQLNGGTELANEVERP